MSPNWGVILILVLLAGGRSEAALLLNEIVTANVTGLPDEYEADLQNCPVPDCPQWYRDLGESVYDGEYPDWIEIFNSGSEAVNLLGYGLSDDADDLFQWTFPEYELAPETYLVVFASGKNKFEESLHTNFKLGREGEILFLTRPDGTVIQRVAIATLPVDFSMGRDPQSPDQWSVYHLPTPGLENSSISFTGFSDTLEASHPPGFHPETFFLELRSSDSNTEIYFTTSGDSPTQNSTRYESPIEISQTTVVRARSFKNNQPASRLLTCTYLIQENFSMPVISLSTDPKNLWDDEVGIYTPGPNARESQRIANYWNDWERPIHVEFFETDEELAFSLDAGMKIFGWGSRQNPQKSLSLFFRDKYGAPVLEYQVFPELDLDLFKALVLRAGGSDATGEGTFFRDPFATRLIENKNLDVQAFRPAIVFINGAYWGIQNIREKLNEDYLASHHGIDKDNVDIISRYWRRTWPVVIEGDEEDILNLETFLATRDMSAPGTYQQIRDRIDVDNFLDYSVAQIYFANYDWPGNNSKMWRDKADGKWRWLMYDLDYTLSFRGNQNNATHNTLEHALTPDATGWPNPGWTTLILRKLIENPTIQNQFINRMADLMNTAFGPERTGLALNDMRARFSSEMGRHINRWRDEGNVISSILNWNANIGTVRTFLNTRQRFVLNHFISRFNLSGFSDLDLQVIPEGSAMIQINSIRTDSSSWQGVYFHDIPITVSILPKPGFQFLHWSGSSIPQTGESSLSITLTGPQTLTAQLEPSPGALNQIVINEINYHSPGNLDSGDWVEMVNTYDIPVDLSGWHLKDEKLGHVFLFPENTILHPREYLVVATDPQKFQSVHPEVTGFVGGMNFKFGNGGDHIRLFDNEKNGIDDVLYDDAVHWPSEPDGKGPTLSLMDPGLDNHLPGNWAASLTNLGTPGEANEFTPQTHPPVIVGAILAQDRKLVITIVSEPGATYTIQTSGDLNSWVHHRSLTADSETTLFTENLPVESGRKFFRIAP